MPDPERLSQSGDRERSEIRPWLRDLRLQDDDALNTTEGQMVLRALATPTPGLIDVLRLCTGLSEQEVKLSLDALREALNASA